MAREVKAVKKVTAVIGMLMPVVQSDVSGSGWVRVCLKTKSG